MLAVSRSAYYAWRNGEPSKRVLADEALSHRVRTIFWCHRRRYGTRRIASELADQAVVCSPRRVAKLLKMQGLRAIQPKSFVPKTTDSRHRLGDSPNRISEPITVKAVDRLWVGDITYLPLRRGGFCYLAVLMDFWSRDIVGWSIADSMTEELTRTVLCRSIHDRQPQPGLMHHTDRGGQYASQAYRAMLRRAEMIQSMSRADNCYDNAFMESCFGTLKTEMGKTEYDSVVSARAEIEEYIRYYRFERKHSSLQYRTPHQFARQQTGATEGSHLSVKP